MSSYKVPSREEVLARFGLVASSSRRQSVAQSAHDDEVVELQSSQEPQDSAAQLGERSSGASSSNVVQYLDTARLVMVRTVAGKSVDARMTPGENGFMIANFGDGDIATEVPSVLFESMQLLPALSPNWNSKSKAKGKAKGKAKSKAKAAAAKSRATAKGKSKAKAKSKSQSKPRSRSEDLEEEGEEEEEEEDSDESEEVPTDLYDKKGKFVMQSPDYKSFANRAAAQDRNGKVVGWKTRLSEYPTGCGTCRKVPGCTPSCWAKRGSK